jgi:hypothetical protein
LLQNARRFVGQRIAGNAVGANAFGCEDFSAFDKNATGPERAAKLLDVVAQIGALDFVDFVGIFEAVAIIVNPVTRRLPGVLAFF